MKKNLLIVCSVVFFLNFKLVFATEFIKAPFVNYKNDVPVQLIQVTTSQLKKSPGSTSKKNYIPLRIMESKAGAANDFCNRPVLVFMGGFVPWLKWTSYETLLTKLAQRNITVIYPEYLPASKLTKIGYMMFGYDSAKLTQRVQKSVGQYISAHYASCASKPRVVVYAHSFGTRIAAGLANDNQLNIQGLILDGVTMQNDDGKIADKQKLCIDVPPQNVKSWNFPLSVLHYQDDLHMKESTDRAYSQCQANFKQYFEISNSTDAQGKKYLADHFSSFSDSTEKDLSFRSKTEKIHGYKIHLGWDIFDENVTLPLLSSLAWAIETEQNTCNGAEKIWAGLYDVSSKISDCDFAKSVRAWAVNEMYGKNRNSDPSGTSIRNIRSENGKL